MRLTGSRRAAAVGALAFLLAVTAYGIVGVVRSGGASGDASPRVLGPGPVTVRLVVRDSHFSPSRVHVRPHTELTFEVANHDFLNHEFIIGDAEVHAIHEAGHEAYHPPKPGEVSIPPHTTGVTTYTVHEPGRVLFACHLPGHFAYGMKGYVIVDAD